MQVRTRVAPSPTGFPHLGTLYQALIDKAIALKNNGQFLLRIEDTDQSRTVPGAIESIYAFLQTFNLSPDQDAEKGDQYGPYVQSKRLNLYKEHAEKLIQKGYAYYCFCSKDRLDALRKDQEKNKQVPMYDKHCRNFDTAEVQKKIEQGETYVVRMKIPLNQKLIVNDLLRGTIEFESNGIDDQVLLKADGFPTYHLASIVDDHFMGITHVVRGPEWIPSFPKHKLLYDYFGWNMPTFIHTPIISNMDGSKLSKRNGHASVDWYLRKGFLPEAVINFISLLGWSHPEQKEIFSYDEFVSVFEPKNLSTVNPKLDLVKLEWMNSHYLKSLAPENYIQRLKGWLDHCLNTEFKGAAEYSTHWTQSDYKDFKNFVDSLSESNAEIFAQINQERVKIFEDLLPLNEFFIKEKELDLVELLKIRSAAELDNMLHWFLNELGNIEWTISDLKDLESKCVEYAKSLNLKLGDFFTPIRLIICKSKISPPLFESMYLLGKLKTLKEISFAIDKI
jgi:glutamyl-tRNA synthetase